MQHDSHGDGSGALATWEDLHAELALFRDEILTTLRSELRVMTRWLAVALLATVTINTAILTVLLPA